MGIGQEQEVMVQIMLRVLIINRSVRQGDNVSSLPISREEAIALLKSMPQLDSDMNHYLETEAIMRSLAEKFGDDVNIGVC